MAVKFDPHARQWMAETIDTGSDCTTLDDSLETAAKMFPKPFSKLTVSRSAIRKRLLEVGYVSFYGLNIFYIETSNERLIQ